MKFLPIKEPIVAAYTHIGIAFSLFLTDERLYPWILNNYIQIYSLRDMHLVEERTGTLDFFYNIYGDWEMFQFSANPYIECEKISFSTISLIQRSVDLCDVLVHAIDNNKYIYMPVDKYGLSVYNEFQHKHRVHHIFLIGYDEQEQVFYAYDTFKDGKYECKKLNYEDIKNAYSILVSNQNVSEWSELGGICCYRLRMNPWQENKHELYEINMETILSGIGEYLRLPEYCGIYSHISHFRYGIDCYIDLESWLLYGADQRRSTVDHRAFSAMRDHKKVMLFRMKYLQKYFHIDLTKYIIAYEKIKKDLDIVIYKIIKGNLTGKREEYSECVKILKEIRACEEITLMDFFVSCKDRNIGA